MAISETEAFVPGPTGRLFTRHYHPDQEPWADLALLHGYGEHGARHAPLLRWLAERGIAGHTLDFRGQGRSDGRRGYVARWHDYLGDLGAFLRSEPFAPSRERARPLFVLGHSHGGLVLAAAVEEHLPELEHVSGTVLTAPYFRCAFSVPRSKQILARAVSPILPWLQVPSGLKNEWMSADEAMVAESRHDPLVSKVATPRWWVEHLKAQDEVIRKAPEYGKPLLMVIAGKDPVADPAVAGAFYEACGSQDKTLDFRPNALHEVLREADRAELFATIFVWLRAHAAPQDA